MGLKKKKFFRISLVVLILVNTLFKSNLVYSNSMDNKKWVIGANKNWGLFASLFCALSHIMLCIKNNKTPVVYWSNDSLYYMPTKSEVYNNVWEYYFYPVSELNYEQGDVIHRYYPYPHPTNIIPNLFNKGNTTSGKFSERFAIKSIIDRYIKIKPEIVNKIDKFFKEKMLNKKTIGIHLRGTDKSTEYPYAPAIKLLIEANKYENYQYFIATDEEVLLELAKKTLRGSVVYYDSFRSKDGVPVHYKNPNHANTGEEALIETVLLSKCDKFIHTLSNISMAVLCFNPELENIPVCLTKKKLLENMSKFI